MVDCNDYIFYEDSGKSEYYFVSYVGEQTELSLPEIGHNYAICDYAFEGCINLAAITVPESVTGIGDCAFEDCVGLTEIFIRDGVTSIGKSAFRFLRKTRKSNDPEERDVDRQRRICGLQKGRIFLRGRRGSPIDRDKKTETSFSSGGPGT